MRAVGNLIRIVNDRDHPSGPASPGMREIIRGPACSFCVLSRAEAQHRTFEEPYLLISIGNPGQRVPRLPDCSRRIAVLRLEFADVDDWKRGDDGFTTDHADDVIRFVERHSVSLIVVQCEAGIRRSSAVAEALWLWLNGEPGSSVFSERFDPNPRVRELLLDRLAQR